MVMDASGALHLATCGTFERSRVRYATNESGAWSILDVDEGNFLDCSLAQTRTGTLVLFYDSRDTNLHQAVLGEDDWVVSDVKLAESQLGPNREPHISWADDVTARFTTPAAAEVRRRGGGEGVTGR